MKPRRPLAPITRRALASTATATLVVGVVVAAVEWGAGASDLVASYGGALVALAFLGLPLLWTRGTPERLDPHGLGDGAILRPVAVALVASLVVLPVFALAFHLDAWLVRDRLSPGPALHSRGVAWQDRPDRVVGAVVVYEEAAGLVVENGLDRTVRLSPQCADQGADEIASAACRDSLLPPGARLIVRAMAHRPMLVFAADGTDLAAGEVVSGRERTAVEGHRVDADPSAWWLIWLLAQQLVVVAIPEEIFFRGWLLARLKRALPPTREVFGVSFGIAHVLSAALFALIHLAAVQSPYRLLVFFPGLLFGWLRERGGSTISPAVHHALANVLMHVLQRSYF